MVRSASMHFESLTIADCEAHPVWELSNDDEDEMSVLPVDPTPVTSLMNRFVATRVRLANGRSVWACVWNVVVGDPHATEHFIHLSVERDGAWFPLARYFDGGYEDYGPTGLARFLGLPVDEVFPIEYDLRPFVLGESPALYGTIPKTPRERLDSNERIRLAIATSAPAPAPPPSPETPGRRDEMFILPFGRKTWVIGGLKGILRSDPDDQTTGFGEAQLRRTRRVELTFWTKKAEAAEVAALVEEVKAMIQRRGRAPDGTTVPEIHIHDLRTGRTY
jgi:hypothetical protein